MTSRPSLELQLEHGKLVQSAKALQTRLDNADIQLVKKAAELNAHRLDTDEFVEYDDESLHKDPAIVRMDVSDQIAYLRRLKFQYLEQNAKDKFVKSIVSDIDDAPIVTAEQNKELSLANEEKKEKLKVAKGKLAEVQENIKLLSPMVEQDYRRIKEATDRAALLSQKIIEARMSLMLLRQTHPHPRMTVPLAEKKAEDLTEEMQTLHDEVQLVKQQGKAEKEKVKTEALEVENLRIEVAEAEKSVKAAQVEEDDSRLVPLYDWYTASLSLQRSIWNLEQSKSSSENELILTYKLDSPSANIQPCITFTLAFALDTKELKTAEVSGLEAIGCEVDQDLIAAHIHENNPQGLVAAVLARAREVASR
ncbi:hypothetical protein CVT24_007436 [Panaeolus cyanescens]|uniref:Kinetochore protein Sos7 coiled-coil domain-containing protein n=1 Tax=Panaeolus cyanescens TaxID=181874 RepID=A0A409W9S8_9AGAR|nr:hypothetical protein CVT24_007436 [Panaeolus cyanescens]